MPAKKQVAKKAETDIVQATPVMGENGMIAGLEGVTQDLLIIPRLKLVQKISVETDEGVAPGSIVNSVTKDVIPQPVTLFPLINKMSRIYFLPMSEGGGISCQANDGLTGQGTPGGLCAQCSMADFTTDDKGKAVGTKCTQLLNVYCHVRGYDFPIPLTASFGKTSMKAGRQLVNYFWADAQKHKNNPWTFAYNLETEMKENDKGKWYVFKITPAGRAEVDEVLRGSSFFELIKSTSIQVHEDEDEVVAEQSRMDESAKQPPPPPVEDDEDPF